MLVKSFVAIDWSTAGNCPQNEVDLAYIKPYYSLHSKSKHAAINLVNVSVMEICICVTA
jgi:hypothetical protein